MATNCRTFIPLILKYVQLVLKLKLGGGGGGGGGGGEQENLFFFFFKNQKIF